MSVLETSVTVEVTLGSVGERLAEEVTVVVRGAPSVNVVKLGLLFSCAK